jgi:hypothetical protein
MLLPLPANVVRKMSLENHLALSAIRRGHGTPETMVTLLRVLYMTYFMSAPASAGADLQLFLDVETVLDRSILAAEQGCDWQLQPEWLPAIERILLRFDDIVGSVPKYRYVESWDKLCRFVGSARQSPLPGSRLDGVWQ